VHEIGYRVVDWSLSSVWCPISAAVIKPLQHVIWSFYRQQFARTFKSGRRSVSSSPSHTEHTRAGRLLVEQRHNFSLSAIGRHFHRRHRTAQVSVRRCRHRSRLTTATNDCATQVGLQNRDRLFILLNLLLFIIIIIIIIIITWFKHTLCHSL